MGWEEMVERTSLKPILDETTDEVPILLTSLRLSHCESPLGSVSLSGLNFRRACLNEHNHMMEWMSNGTGGGVHLTGLGVEKKWRYSAASKALPPCVRHLSELWDHLWLERLRNGSDLGWKVIIAGGYIERVLSECISAFEEGTPTSEKNGDVIVGIDVFLPYERDYQEALFRTIRKYIERVIVHLRRVSVGKDGMRLELKRTEDTTSRALYGPPSLKMSDWILVRLIPVPGSNPSEIINKFDLDCRCVFFDGNDIHALPRALKAWSMLCNVFRPSRVSPGFTSRVMRYMHRGYNLLFPHPYADMARAAEHRYPVNFPPPQWSTSEEVGPSSHREFGSFIELLVRVTQKGFCFRKEACGLLGDPVLVYNAPTAMHFYLEEQSPYVNRWEEMTLALLGRGERSEYGRLSPEWTSRYGNSWYTFDRVFTVEDPARPGIRPKLEAAIEDMARPGVRVHSLNGVRVRSMAVVEDAHPTHGRDDLIDSCFDVDHYRVVDRTRQPGKSQRLDLVLQQETVQRLLRELHNYFHGGSYSLDSVREHLPRRMIEQEIVEKMNKLEVLLVASTDESTSNLIDAAQSAVRAMAEHTIALSIQMIANSPITATLERIANREGVHVDSGWVADWFGINS